MTLYQKLSKIRKLVEVVQKQSQGFNYKYTNEQDVLAKITAGMEKYNVDVYPSIVPQTIHITPVQYDKAKKLKDGTLMTEQINESIVSAEMEYTWVNLDSPEDKMTVHWAMMGQNAGVSQAFGSGLTYCTRYFLLKFFKASTTEDDPDNWRKKQKDARDEEDLLITKEITEQISDLIKKNRTVDNEEAIKKIIKSTVRDKGKASANYLIIKDPLIAKKVYEDLFAYFNDNKEDK